MSEIMRPIAFGNALRWALDEYRAKETVFGLAKSRFYKGGRVTVLNEQLGSAIGPAAGPNTQLAQNIVAACLAGGRLVELKTVQAMDGEQLRSCISRPCINAEDEGYNVEWSTELTVGEAMDEYIKAWFMLHVLMKELGLSQSRDFAFNMSVGYSLEGIRSPKLDGYIEGLKDARGTEIWKECHAFLERSIGTLERFDINDLSSISPAVAKSVTLSTLHGCPKEEIERIAAYLITEKGLHTYIKCNPTLLGYEFARTLLDKMGYGYIAFTSHHFDNDLQFNDAVSMFKRLAALAKERGLLFGLKLTNTFPVKIKQNELPGEEMYMSGRALYPLTISLAAKLAREFNGALPISFSGGADYFNIAELLKTGIRPVTVATTILKPGGYARLNQLAKAEVPDTNAIDVNALSALAKNVSQNARHKKDYREVRSRKIPTALEPYDCAIAPCSEGCPINQRIPEYLALVGREDYAGAYGVIINDNAAPAITAELCDHKCQTKCTRIDYDDSLRIREMKKTAVYHAADGFAITAPPLRTDKKAVAIGGGAAGIAAAIYLRRAGMSATVLEKRKEPFGIVSHVIPSFRLPQKALLRDLALAKGSGVDIRCGVDENYDISELKKEYDYIILATGAWGRSECGLESGEELLTDALEFLQSARNGKLEATNIAVIGGGDVAMDCARAAKRGGAQTHIVYRRTKKYMPAAREELELAVADGVRLVELCMPVSYDGESLVCEVMEYAADGRREVKGTGEYKTMKFDMVISATGATAETEHFRRNGIELTRQGFPKCGEANETNLENVFAAGDCKAGPATVVKALADSKRIAKAILSREGLSHAFAEPDSDAGKAEARERKGILSAPIDGQEEAKRCLACDTVCELCVDVCPNRANMALDNGQILHIDGMCNECGNCASFCPHENGAPYKDKVTLYWSEEDFDEGENIGFVKLGENTYRVRREDKATVEYPGGDISKELQSMIENVPEWVRC